MHPDQWLVKQLMRFFVWRYRGTVQNELHRLSLQADIYRRETLVASLGSAGVHVNILWGAKITYPENVHLGSYMSIGENCFIMGQGGVTIGDFGLLANHTVIVTVSHHMDGIYYGHDFQSPVVLGENVWTGSGAIILPGVTIGDNAIIGAGAVVTNDIPANKIALGIPARPVRDVPQDPEKRRQQAASIRAGELHSSIKS